MKNGTVEEPMKESVIILSGGMDSVPLLHDHAADIALLLRGANHAEQGMA